MDFKSLSIIALSTCFFLSSCGNSASKNNSNATEETVTTEETTPKEESKKEVTVAPKPETPKKEEPKTPVKEKPAPPVKEKPAEPVPPKKEEAPAPKIVTIGKGQDLSIKLSEELNTLEVSTGQAFKGTFSSPVSVNGETVIPAGTPVTGTIVHAQNQKKLGGKSMLHLTLNKVTVKGTQYAFATNTLEFESKNQVGETATKAGAGAALGAAIGAISSKKGEKGKGAAIGAAVGTAAGVGATALKKKESMVMEAGTVLDFEFTENLKVTL